MSWEPFHFGNELQRFLLAQRDWLVRVATRFLNFYRLPNIGEDIVHDLAINLKMSNERWNRIKNKKAYLAKIIRNDVRDLFKNYPGRNQPLPECRNGFSPDKAMEAGRLIEQLHQKLLADEKQLLELFFERRSFEEIAERFQIAPAAARKRWERLKKKLRLLIQERGDRE
ncbi:MAG TPA: sigma-70 family RNA polymerase sigma factor [Pyrinomonadaceae bacterium]|jgi:RNA polymerase sigma factor (sigma-70 family)|nr:sigma-70 family RNA polymerase sigma factor [Pyrinomonadaceae bacterium]